jgi:hypothetical protein
VKTPTCVWRTTDTLITALADRFGDPIDAYVNGSQTWLREDAPDEVVIEWRLHPVGGYIRPKGLGTYDVFPRIAQALADGVQPPASPESLWDGLEAFPAYGDEMEPATLQAVCVEALGLPPDVFGLVDHRPISDEWERSGRRSSIVGRLLEQLSA